MKYKLDNGEILECDAICVVGMDEILVNSLSTSPQIYTSRFIKAATWALANGYQRLRYIGYEINGKVFTKFIPSTEGSMRRAQWERLHYYHGKI
jgi:hypothetical protein